MKLFFSPGACSLSPHIVAREAGIGIELVRIEPKDKRTSDDRDYLAINPKGNVPALELDDGRVLTEGVAIVQYLGDLRPDTGLVPPAGSFQRYRMQEALNFIATELHKGFTPLFYRPSDEERAKLEAKLARRFEDVVRQLGSQRHWFGDEFSAADAYLFTILRWAEFTKIPLPPTLAAFVERVGSRPAVRNALAAEGIFAA
jgi:glutathione S-transferase